MPIGLDRSDGIYIVDNMADAITESAEEGTDTVRASVTHSLSQNVENLVLVGANNIDGTGNELTNTITGNAGSNVLDGGAGADILRGGDGSDTYVVDHLGDTVLEARGEGDDVVLASVDFTLEAELESLVLTGTGNINGTGNALANSIIGNDGANILDGGAGADNLRGGLGNDTYVVDDADDLVTEASEQGTDTVRASISYALADEVEHLVLTGTEDLSGTGNGLDNALTGNSGSNVLVGHQGNDTLDGGAGRDTARFTGNRQNYTIVEQPDGSFIVTDNVGDDGVDVVQNVEVLQFRDQSVSLTNKAPAKPVVQGSVIPVDENAAPHRVVATVLSTDSEGDALEYSFVTNPGNKFAIDPTNGVITLIGAVNYEATATEDPDLETETTGPLTGQKFYRVVVKATETVSGVSSGETELKVYVNDVNEAPTGLSFSGGGITATISENANDGDLVGVGTLQALDPEGLNQFIYAFDTSGAGGSSGSGNAGGRFKIEGGQLKVAALSDITRAETYTVTIKVTDRNGGPGAVSTYQDFLITVNPVDTGNTAPTNVRLASGGTVAEKSGFNATVGTVTATDNGGAANLRYTIADNAEFDIDAVTGRIFVKDGAVLDYEGARTYTVQVTATDTNGTGLSSDPQDIIITLSDVNEAATGVDFTGGPTLRAGAGLGAAVAVAAAVDPDTGTTAFRNNKYRFANGTLEDGLFRINADTGAITTTRAVTAEDVGEKTLTVVAHDGALVGPAATYTFDILPALPNAAPTAPVVQGSVSAIDENSAPHKVIATVKASDAEGDAFTYALAVNPGNKFTINATTGVITLVGAVDYEQDPDLQVENEGTLLERKFYELTVKATQTSDTASSGETTVRVYVNDVNEAPTGLSFTNGTRAATISEADAVDGYEIGILQAFDPEGDDNLIFAFDTSGRGGSSGSGNAGGRFKIEDGKLKIAAFSDITKAETYTVTIKVTDQNGDEGSTSTYRDFLIRVTPATETPTPALSIAATASSVQTEGDDGFKEFVFTVNRTNASGDTQAEWRITGTGITAADFEALNGTVHFTGDQTTQEIRVKVRGDTSFESNETFTITLSNATNGQIVGSSATGRIDNDDPAPTVPTVQFDTANPMVEHAEGAAGTTVTYTYTLTRDSDVGRSVVAWAVTGSGVTAADFGGTVPNGTATFEAGETSTTFTVTVSGDAEFEPTEGFVVTLSQAANGNATIGPNSTATGTITNDDAEPIPQANRAPDNIAPNTFMVQELAGARTKVGSVSTTDPDGDQLSYELISNAEGRFKLVGTDLLVDDGFRLDHEQAASHQVKVRVRDTAGHVVDQTLTIGVTDWVSESTGGSAANDVFKGGRGNDVLSGGLGNDRLFGGIDNDTLRGEAGNDIIGGGEGKDKLYGLKGAASRDAFLFDTKLTSKSVANKHKDTVYDFGSRFDSIYLDDAAFTNATIARQLKNKGASLDKPFKMKAGFFKVGTKATDRDDFFIYNDRNKKLYWDVDGSGRKAMVEIATFKFERGEGAAKLAASDFFFV